MGEARHVDGNALGGLLMEAFGREMTAARERCGGCGSVRELGALIAYTRGPGDVLRCPDCDTVLMVCVRRGGGYRVAMRSVAWLDLPADA
jgi:hypothetical protein